MQRRPDPSENVKKDVIKWYRDILCFPTWEELLEVEYVRQLGKLNMFTDDIVAFCMKNGLLNAVAWYRRLSAAQVLPTTVFGVAVRYYTDEKGPIDSWLTDEVMNEFKSRV